jgi:hypothetical protein
MTLDGLRPPALFDPTADAYKDWLHLNVFEPRSGLAGLVNVAVHGPAEDPRTRVVGTALMHLPGLGWAGNVEIRGLAATAVGEHLVGLRDIALALDPARGDVHASAALPLDGVAAAVTARSDSPPYAAPGRLPFGDGWLRWTATPRLRPRGRLQVFGRSIDLTDGVAYHDHNWGRWRWGDDVGWEWGCFSSAGDGVTAVLSRTTDRDHRAAGVPQLLVQRGDRRWTFTGRMVRIDRAGLVGARARRLPGALAALHGDRARPRLPAEVAVEAADGRDAVRLRFRSADAVQIAVAEVTRPGYGFIHEVAGSFELDGRLAGAEVRTRGPAIYEHVD